MSDPQFIRSTAPHIVEVAEGSHNAKSKSATIGTDAQRAYTNSTAFIHADPLAELKTVFFDEQSTMAARPSLELDAAEAHALVLSSTSGPPVIAASAALNEPDKTPSSSQAHFKSHYSDQIGELKAKNDHVRAELKRRETAPSNKT